MTRKCPLRAGKGDIPLGDEEGEVVVIVPDFFYYASGNRRLRD